MGLGSFKGRGHLYGINQSVGESEPLHGDVKEEEHEAGGKLEKSQPRSGSENGPKFHKDFGRIQEGFNERKQAPKTLG